MIRGTSLSLQDTILTMIIGLHHAQITIPIGAEDEARRFYCDLLGLLEIAKPESLRDRGGLWLQLGDRSVHLGVEDGVDRHRTKAHLAYEVSDLSEVRQRLIAHGVEIIESVPIPDHERFEFRDPFDNRVEMIQRV